MDVKDWIRTQPDRVAAIVGFVVASLMLLVGWFGLSDEVFSAAQIPYLMSGGVGGLFVLGVSATLWLSADLRDEWRKLDELEQRIGRLAESHGDTEPPADATPRGNGARARKAASPA